MEKVQEVLTLKSKIILIVVLLLSCSRSIPADQQHHHHEMTAEKLGNVHFAVSCSEDAQKQFDRAVALLHSFGYGRAEKAFNTVAETDPDCAMAYWGVAQTQFHQYWAAAAPAMAPKPEELQKGSAAVEKARSTGKPSQREKDYIEAIGIFYKDSGKLDHQTRALAYEKAMARIHQTYPEDNEAAIFYALSLLAISSPMDKTYANQKKAAEILNGLMDNHSEHPGIAHYIIHSYDYPALANLALDAARKYSKIAPSSPHALHMPSHIFTRLGLWQESIDSNIASAASALAFAQKDDPKSGSFDQLHAMDYLIYAYLQTGQDQKAKQVVSEFNALSKLDQVNLAAAYAAAAINVRYAIERNQWADAAALTPGTSFVPWDQFPSPEAIVYFGRGIGSARTGNLDEARKSLEKLDALHQTLIAAKDMYWAGQVEIQRKEVAASIAQAEGKKEQAIELMKAAVDLEGKTEKHAVTPGAIIPARELLGSLLLELKQPVAAVTEFEKSLAVAPNRFNALYGAARSAQLSGDNQKAETYYAKLVSLCNSNCSRAEFMEAKAFLAKR
jgi:tetratricopeptide (TPR) repeat protein